MEAALAADAKRQDEDRFRECFELAVVGMAITSPEKGFVDVNDKLCEILGYERSELLAMSWPRLTHPDDVAADVAQFQRVMAGEIDGYAMDKRFVRKDGRVIHATMSVKCHRDADGAVDYFLAVAQDISERVSADEAASRLRDELSDRVSDRTHELRVVNEALIHELVGHRKTEVLLREAVTKIELVLESITDQFFALDADWRFVYLNQRAREQVTALGKDPALLIGAVLWDEFPQVPNEAALRRVMAERVALTDELYYAPLGQWVENHMYPSPGGGLVTFQKYISERKRAQEALRLSEENLAEVQRLCHTGSGSWNVVTGAVFWSDETCRVYGVPPGTVPSDPEMFFGRVVHPEDQASLRQLFERVVRDKSDYEVQFRVVHPDGTIRHVQSVGRSVVDDVGQLRVVGTVMDVTERMRVEEALAKTRAELARVSRIATLGELTALITHEVSQPLASIVMDGSAGLRWLAHRPPNLEETRNAVERIVREGNRAGDVIRRLRGLVARTRTQADSFQVNDAIHEMVSLAQSELTSKRISLHLTLAPALPPVFGDRVQVSQVILNLLVNAIEAMAEVRDRPRQMVIATQLHETDKVLVSVADSGDGFAPHVLDCIFDPFVTTKPEGMGLGLSMSRTIVEHHGGRLWAAGNLPQGAALFFTLPLAGR
ncbi:MAG TPA: PAS domain S-box protein [Albitalea sp.]|nr:PAS domain S-box protein [Albitalea sp.]